MKVVVICILLSLGLSGVSQVTSGKIVFERRTNLLKKFEDERTREWLRGKKIKTDIFELYFNDTMSVFKPQESDLVEEMDWATTKNTVYQNLNRNERLSILGVWGDNVYVLDSLKVREWKMTNSKRKIAGYECRRVIWQKDDTTRIHAWFTSEIVPSVGPESFGGLPGTILGLATEDGGVVYFAKSVTIGVEDIEKQIPKYPTKKAKKEAELKEELTAKFGDKPWGKLMLESIFAW